MKIFVVLLCLSINSIFASSIKEPVYTFTSSGMVIDLFYKNNTIYSSTDAGIIDTFDLKTRKIKKRIKVDQIEDFMGDLVDSKIFSVDEEDGDIMILSQSKKGFSRLHVHSKNENRLLIDHTEMLSIIKAKYLNKNTVILALLGNEIISYDIQKNIQNYRIQVSGAKFSDFVLNEEKTEIAVTDESGDVQILNTANGKNIKTLTGENVDNIFQLSYKNGVVATAGQDRRVGVYSTKQNSSYHKKSSFLVYSVGLSPSANLAAYASDENNNVTLFNTKTESTIGRYGKNSMTISNIVFINEESFLVSGGKTINLYKID